jgi:hypothetical protein
VPASHPDLESRVRTVRVLDSDYLLKELVREADIEWGRILGERRYFEKEGCPPHPDDPYTIESVRATLSRLIEKLTGGDPSSEPGRKPCGN